MPGQVILGLVLIISVGLFLQAMYKRFRLIRLGQPENRCDKIRARLKFTLINILGHARLFDQTFSGILHFMIFWGFIVFTFGYIFMIGGGFIPGFSTERLLGHGFANIYTGFQNLFGILVIFGVGLALFQRLILRPKRLENTIGAIAILFVILFIMLTYFASDGIQQMFLTRSGQPFDYALVSSRLARGFDKSGWSPVFLTSLFQWLWWLHLTAILGFLIYIPHSKHLHMIIGPFNVFFRSLAPKGRLKFIDLENTETFGVARITEYTWKDMLDLYACTECGRCQVECPTHRSDKPLSPKKLITDLRNYLNKESSQLLKATKKAELSEGNTLCPSVLSDDTIWACTTCRYCQEQCPVLIDHIDKVIELRRNLVLAESRFPNEAKSLFKNMETNGNPWPVSWDQRSKWTEGLKVPILDETNSETEYLFWVGCAGATDERNIKIAQALVNILKKTNVKFALLGNQERCCGDPARRLGNEYLFQMLAEGNVATLKKYRFKEIITCCPHCFNTLKNEYTQFGLDLKVRHHTQFIQHLIQTSQLNLSGELIKVLTYHDSCYLGRYNNIYQSPRELLRSVPGVTLKEMPRSKKDSFCCGAGGGRMWLEETIGQRINRIRIEEAVKTNAEIVATACPYCLTMLEDGVKEKEMTESIKVKDIVEIINEVL